MKEITEDGEVIDTMCEDCPTVFFKTPYNHDRDAEERRIATYNSEKSLTDQSFKEEVDINVIIERLKQGGEVNIVLPEHFADDERVDLYTAQTRIAENNATFYKLDADIRSEFKNDVNEWRDQVMKDLRDGNVDDLKRMGIDVELAAHWLPKPPEAPQAGTPAPGAPETPVGGLKAPSGGN